MKPKINKNSMIHWFEYKHLKSPELQEVSKDFYALALKIEQNLDNGKERSVSLRKLLEAKDAAVRAKLFPGA